MEHSEIQNVNSLVHTDTTHEKEKLDEKTTHITHNHEPKYWSRTTTHVDYNLY